MITISKAAAIRHNIEKRVIRRIIMDALAAGYTLSVNNGEETVLRNSSNKAEIIANMFTTDEEHLQFLKNGKYIGWVFLVYGNSGWDVISDYTVNLESVLAGAEALSEKLEN